MGGKNNTSTTTSGPPSDVQNAYRDLLARAQGVASTPYQQYGGPMLAPFSGSQQSAFNTIDQSQGMAQPYLDQAQQYATQGASAITPEQIAQYTNPYTQYVVKATQANFAESNAQQQNQIRGNAITQGALGGDRLGVAQAETARLQKLAQDPVIASLNMQGFNTALSAAQQDTMRKGQAAYTFGNLGQEAQGLALSGAGAQLQSGGQQQQQAQQALNIPYQQWLQQQAFPYQQTGWLAGLTTGVGSQLGGTSTTQSPGPNPWGQALGLGVAGLGVAGGLGWKPFAASGGRIKGYAEGGFAMSPNQDGSIGIGVTPYGAPVKWIPTMNMGRGAGAPKQGGQMADPNANVSKMVGTALDLAGKMRGRGGEEIPLVSQTGATYGAPQIPGQDMTYGSMGGVAVPTMWAHGGFVEPEPNGIYVPRGYDLGGNVEQPLTFAQRAEPVKGAVANGQFDPQGRNYTNFGGMQPVAQQDIPLPLARPTYTAQEEQPAIGGASTIPLMGNAEGGPEDDGSSLELSANEKKPASQTASGYDNLWPALISAGFGMMASRSPFLGTAIGEGGMQGVQTYTKQKEFERDQSNKDRSFGLQTRSVDLRAQDLTQRAKQAADHIKLQTEQFKESQKQHAVTQMQPVKIGSGIYGDVYGLRDPTTGKITPLDPRTGAPVENGVGEQSSAAPAQEQSTLPASAQTVSFLTINDPAAGNYRADALEGVDKGISETVKAIAEGRRAPLTLGRNNAYNRNVMELVGRYNPTYDATTFPSRQRTINAFKAGMEGRNVTSLNTVGQHLEELYKAATDLDNSRIPIYNAVNQFVRWQGGDKDYQDKLKAYENAAKAVSTEAAKAFMGTGQTALADREEWMKLFGQTDPLNAQLSGIRKTVKLLDGRISALGAQYNQGMSTSHDPYQLLQPKTKEAFDRMRSAGEDGKSASDPLAGAKAAIAKGAPREAVIKRLQERGIDASGL